MKIFAFLFLGVVLTGCVVLETGPISSNEQPLQKCEAKVHVKKLDRILKRIRPEAGKAALTLSATGDFDVDYEQKVDITESVIGRTGVGFFPWTLADRPRDMPVIDHLLAVFVNYGLALTPTLYSWFIEPYSEYPSTGVNDHVFAGFSLLGAYRYCDEPVVKRKYSRVDRSKITKKIHRIEDFTIDYGGRTYRSEDGRVVLPLPYELGMSIDARVASLTVRSEELRGVILSPECQSKPWCSDRKSQAKDQQTTVVRNETAMPGRSNLRLAEALIGKWESYQSHKTITHVESTGKNTEYNQTLHYTYEFFCDGELRLTTEIAAKETNWRGRWKIDGDGLRMKMRNMNGSDSTIDFTVTRLSSGDLMCRYADLRTFEKFFLKGSIKSAHATYNSNNELQLRLEMESRDKDGKVDRSVSNSVYSPIILEKIDE